MSKALFALLVLLPLVFAANWNVHSGYGTGTGVASAPSPWAVLRFFPDNITVVQDDTITFIHKSDGHTVTFYQTVLDSFSDPVNLFLDPAILPIPAGGGLSVDSPVNVTSNNTRYSSGLMATVGQNWTVRFPVPGVYLFFCLLHPGQAGYVTVLPAGQTAPQTQAQIDASRNAAYAVLDQTATTLRSSIKDTPVRTPKSDGTTMITIDNGYGSRDLGFSLNHFGPSEFYANVGDTLNFVIKDFAGGHTIAFNASTANSEGDYYWNFFLPLANGTIVGSKEYFRAFGDNTAWSGQFVSGGLLLPPGAPGAVSSFNLTISPNLASLHTLPKRFRFLCNIHTAPPESLPVAVFPNRTYVGQVGYVTIYPKGVTPSPSGSSTPTPTPTSGAEVLKMMWIALSLALIVLFY